MEDILAHALTSNSSCYVAVDGALHRDISQWCSVNQVRGEALFRAETGRDVMLAGPWMLSADRNQLSIQRLLQKVKLYGRGVCWISQVDCDGMFRHLRRLNIARLHDQRIVYFRHYDPDVLSWLAQKLNGEQASQLLGPALLIGFIGGSADGGTISRPENLPKLPAYPIAFTEVQFKEMVERQQSISRKKILLYLRDKYSKLLDRTSDEQAMKKIIENEQEGRSMGLKTESSLAKWIEMSLATNGATNRNPEVARHISRLGRERCDEVIEADWQEIIGAFDASRSHRISGG